MNRSERDRQQSRSNAIHAAVEADRRALAKVERRALAKVNRARRIQLAKMRRQGPLGRFIVWLLGDFDKYP